MASQEWSFTGPKAYRSKHVAPGVWERHKPELEELYEKKSLEEVMLHMKTKGFSPSKRQYIYQFDKWGFQKYNKTANGSANPKVFDASNSSSEVVTGPSDHDQRSLLLSPSVPLATKRKCTEPEQYEKRSKLSNAMSATGYDQPPSETRDWQDKLPELSPNSHTSAILMSSPEEGSTATISEIKGTGSGQVTPSEAYQKSSQLDVSNDTPTQSKRCLLQPNSPDLVELLRDLSTDQVSDIIVAADFLAASQCPDEAFLLFFLVLARDRDRNDVSQQVLECALIGCTRNAAYKWHILATESMLRAYTHDLELQPSTKSGLQALIYGRLIEEVLTKKDLKHQTIRPSRLAAKTVWPEYSLFEALDDKKPLILEVAYQSNKSGREIFPGARVDQTDLQDPKWVHTIDVLEIANIIRQLLCWCERTLKRKVIIQTMSSWCSNDPSRTYYLALYHGLFRAYLEDDKDKSKSPKSDWAKLSGAGMGLSPTRFLANVALMLSKHAGAKFYHCVTEATGQHQGPVWNELAASTCERLSACSDQVLVYDFLSQHYLVSSGTLGSSNFELQWYENEFRPFVKDQIQALLDIRLPSDSKVKLLWCTQVTTNILSNVSSKRNDSEDSASKITKKIVPTETTLSDCTATLTGSLPDSDYHTLEVMRDQYKNTSKQDVVHKELTTSNSIRSQSSWSQMTSDSWSLSRYVPGRGSPTGSQRSWSSVSRYLPGRRSRLSAAVIESIITDCSRISISTNEPEVDDVLGSSNIARQTPAEGI